MTNQRGILQEGVIMDEIDVEEFEEVIAPGMVLCE